MQMGFSRRAFALAAAVGVSALALACSGGGDTAKESGATKPAETKATAAASGGTAGTLNVDLADFTVKAASATTKAGKVTVNVKNAGTTPHEVVFLKTDADPGSLTKDATARVEEAKYAPAGKSKELNGGASEKLEVSLTAGKYVLICNLSGHYDLGMRTALTVN
jgi:uncharacterized cupredoxin-like copper-binding protein